VGRWAGTAIALWALHGVGLARSCLAVREDADVEAVENRLQEPRGVGKNITLRIACFEDAIKLKLKLLTRGVDDLQ
jgi:hypothetical protein